MAEPMVVYATARDVENDDGVPVNVVECRFSDGQKFGAVEVDGDFPSLAFLIARMLNEHAQLREQ